MAIKSSKPMQQKSPDVSSEVAELKEQLDKTPEEKLSPSERLMKEFLEKLPSTLAQATVMAQIAAQPQRAEPERLDKCGECGQFVRACKGKHTRMVVWPKQFAQWFQGIFINGVRYCSNGPGHEVTVPADNNIQAEVDKYETNEAEQAIGKTAFHNSGTLSGKGNHDIKYAEGKGWR